VFLFHIKWERETEKSEYMWEKSKRSFIHKSKKNSQSRGRPRRERQELDYIGFRNCKGYGVVRNKSWKRRVEVSLKTVRRLKVRQKKRGSRTITTHWKKT